MMLAGSNRGNAKVCSLKNIDSHARGNAPVCPQENIDSHADLPTSPMKSHVRTMLHYDNLTLLNVR